MSAWPICNTNFTTPIIFWLFQQNFCNKNRSFVESEKVLLKETNFFGTRYDNNQIWLHMNTYKTFFLIQQQSFIIVYEMNHFNQYSINNHFLTSIAIL